MDPSYSAIVAAGGSGSRFGSNKLREKLGGKAVLSHSLDRFADDDDCVEVVLCAGREVREWIEANPLVFSHPKLRVVDGGPSRAESVRSGVAKATAPVLAIHDGARPNFGDGLLQALKRAVNEDAGAVPVLAVSETVAYVESAAVTEKRDDFFGRSSSVTTVGTLRGYANRTGLHLVQTPQFFYADSYRRALDAADAALASFSDDSSLYLNAGFAVTCVPGAPGNIKLTTPADMQLLLKLMGGGEKKQKDKYGGLGW